MTWFSLKSGMASTGVWSTAYTAHTVNTAASIMTRKRFRMEYSISFSIMGFPVIFSYGGQLGWGRPRPARPAAEAVRRLPSARELLHLPGKPAGVAEKARRRILAGELLHLPGKPAGVGPPARVTIVVFSRLLRSPSGEG